MMLPMVTICLSNGLITSETANGLLNNNPSAGKGLIVGHIFGRTRLVFGFATRNSSHPVQVELVNTNNCEG
jgi:hypothetical protein